MIRPNHPPFIILPKSEWNRLHRQGGPPEEPDYNKQEYLKELTEQSQEWMKSWPDSFASKLAKIENQKKNQDKANIEFIKEFKKAASKVKQENTANAIKEAKQQIFEDSNYGRKLISALLESRVIEEREAQINLNKEIHNKAAELAKQEVFIKGGIHDFHDNDAKRERLEKQKRLECTEANKEIVLLQVEKELQEKEIKNKCAIEADKLMMQVIKIEEEEKEDIKRCEKEKQKQFEADTKKLKQIKLHDEKLTNAIIEAHRKEQDRITLKTRAVLRKVHQGRPDTKWSKNLYKKVEQIQNEQNKRYEDFVDKGVQAYNQRNLQKEVSDKLQEKQNSSKRYLISQMNKIVGQEMALDKKCENKCVCERQTLIMNLFGKPAKTETNGESSTKNLKKQRDHDKKEKLSFLGHPDTLTEELRKREKEPTPWTAAAGTHAHFARQAHNILKEVKHKRFARKVVDEYRNLNSLDDTTLPVPNY